MGLCWRPTAKFGKNTFYYVLLHFDLGHIWASLGGDFDLTIWVTKVAIQFNTIAHNRQFGIDYETDHQECKKPGWPWLTLKTLGVK